MRDKLSSSEDEVSDDRIVDKNYFFASIYFLSFSFDDFNTDGHIFRICIFNVFFFHLVLSIYSIKRSTASIVILMDTVSGFRLYPLEFNRFGISYCWAASDILN